jgi:hypothetical protein
MCYFLLDKSNICINILNNGYDTVGCNLSNYHENIDKTLPVHYSGNFWWANTNYLRTLQYLSMEMISRNDPEFWLFKNCLNFYNLHSSNVNHFLSEYPRHLYAE